MAVARSLYVRWHQQICASGLRPGDVTELGRDTPLARARIVRKVDVEGGHASRYVWERV